MAGGRTIQPGEPRVGDPNYNPIICINFMERMSWAFRSRCLFRHDRHLDYAEGNK